MEIRGVQWLSPKSTIENLKLREQEDEVELKAGPLESRRCRTPDSVQWYIFCILQRGRNENELIVDRPVLFFLL